MNLPKWLQKQPTRKTSDKQERSIAKEFGAKQHPNSGAMYKPFDMSTDNLLIETKTTQTVSYKISLPYWLALKRSAVAKEPVMVIEIRGEKLVLIRKDFFKHLVGKDVL